MDKLKYCNSITEYDELFGFETLNPMVNVVECNEPEKLAKYLLGWGFYAIYLKDIANCVIDYGKTKYDHGNQTIIAFAPGQTTSVENAPGVLPKFIALLFHPDYLHSTSLSEKMTNYSFFSYESNEALHLTDDERDVIYRLMCDIRNTICNDEDLFSKDVIISQIELLCNYCRQFYARQFGTRQEISNHLIATFEHDFNDYINQGIAERDGVPSVAYFADKVHLSSKYFGDLIKTQTGITAQDFIQQRLTNEAKRLLHSSELSVNEVAYRLGFQYPQHFVRFFKRNVNVTPRTYRENVHKSQPLK